MAVDRPQRFLHLILTLWLFVACAPKPTPSIIPAATPAPRLTETQTPTPTGTPPAPLTTITPIPTETPERFWRRTPAPTAATTRIPPKPTATRPTGVRELHVPILMYHYIGAPPANADAIRLDLSVYPERFEEQMAYFAKQGYRTVKLQDVYDAVMKGAPLPVKPVVFTFDDGYDNAYTSALPILQKYNFIGTFYIVTGFLGSPGYLTRDQVVGLSKAGMDVQSHSVTHPSLKGKSADFLRQELVESKRTLETMTGQPVNFFCYPAGQYDALTIRILRESGYLSATTTQMGAWQNEALPYEWPRVRVRGSDQLRDLIKRMRELGIR